MLSTFRTGLFRTVLRKRAVWAAAGVVSIGLVALGTYGIVRATTGVAHAPKGPEIGQRLSAFQAAYGNPGKIGTARGLEVNHVRVEGVRFYADAAHTIIVNAQPTPGKGTIGNVVVTGPASWTSQQSFAACEALLPNGASAYRTTGPYTYFHSHIGDVVIYNVGHGTCQVLLVSDVS